MRGSERHGNCDGQYVCIASVNMEIIYEKNVYVLFKERGHEKVKSPIRRFKLYRKNVSRGTRLCKCLLQKGKPFGSSGINTCFSRRICFF